MGLFEKIYRSLLLRRMGLNWPSCDRGINISSQWVGTQAGRMRGRADAHLRRGEATASTWVPVSGFQNSNPPLEGYGLHAFPSPLVGEDAKSCT